MKYEGRYATDQCSEIDIFVSNEMIYPVGGILGYIFL